MTAAPRKRRPTMSRDVKWFWTHAGMSYTPGNETPAEGRRRCAEEYAADEAWLRTVPHNVEWEHDEHAERDYLSDDGRVDDGRPLWSVRVSARLPGDDPRPADWTFEACGGIDIGWNDTPGSGPEAWMTANVDPYCRIMEAELAGQLRYEFEKRTADRTAYAATAVQAIAAGIFRDDAWDRCPVLADALEDAGHVYAPDLTLLRSEVAHINHEHTRKTNLRNLALDIVAANPTDIAYKMMPAYVTAALWASTGDDGQPLDSHFGPGDLADASRDAMFRDCAALARIAADLIDAHNADDAGHDFWLTRCGHGSGFWAHVGEGERWGHDEFGELTSLAERFGELNVTVGDDNQLYVSRG